MSNEVDDLIVELKKNLAAFSWGFPRHGFRPVRVRTIKAMIETLEEIRAMKLNTKGEIK